MFRGHVELLPGSTASIGIPLKTREPIFGLLEGLFLGCLHDGQINAVTT